MRLLRSQLQKRHEPNSILMAIPNPFDQLKSLRNTLKELKSSSLPLETKQLLYQAIQNLDDIENTLGDRPEHTRLAALYRVSRALGKSLNLEEVLTQVMDAVIDLTNAERGFLMLEDKTTGRMSLRAARNFERETLEDNEAISHSVISTVVGHAKGVITTDAQSDPRFSSKDSVVFHALHSIMCAPLLIRGEVIGVIYVDNRARVGIFTDDDLELLDAFATQAAIAIENARLYTQTDRALAARINELETLSAIDHELASSLDFDHVMEITRQWAVSGTGSHQGWIVLFDLREKPHQVAASSEGHKDDNTRHQFQELVKDFNRIDPKVIPANGNHPTRLIVPIVQMDKTAGAIIVERNSQGPADYPQEAVQFLTRLSQRAALAIENARLYEAIQEANEAKTKFISVVTHELRIPMTAIKGYTDLLRQGAVGKVNENQLDFLNVILTNVDRMSALVADLSDISRIETGRLKLEPEMIPLSQYIEETLSNLRPKIEEKAQTLKVEAPEGLPPMYADPNRVVQILTNLVSNASKYTPSGGKIYIRARPDVDMLLIEVQDSGIGISSEDQKRLFQQFFRSEDQSVREQQGWGLGLNVTKRLIELMGGAIGVQSAPGEGSTFWVRLPKEER
jgi:signal transduction histidine kinase